MSPKAHYEILVLFFFCEYSKFKWPLNSLLWDRWRKCLFMQLAKLWRSWRSLSGKLENLSLWFNDWTSFHLPYNVSLVRIITFFFTRIVISFTSLHYLCVDGTSKKINFWWPLLSFVHIAFLTLFLGITRVSTIGCWDWMVLTKLVK